MNPYKFNLDLCTDNANADIIKLIRPESEVLEFGPAYGRMTKYLREELGCQIDIVEIDMEAGESAGRYARYSCIGVEEGNIENKIWEKKFAGNRYDAIVFTDVLEHLHNPEEILMICKTFLKSDGSILCSIPNIAHSSVILGLLSGEFTYKETGLLDKTHIHFFTEKSFLEMVNSCGYYISYEHAIVMPVGTIELPYTYKLVSKDIENVLKRRSNSEAYQFVFELKHKGSESAEESFTTSQNAYMGKAVCYIKEEDDIEFSEQKKISKIVTSEKNDIRFSFQKFSNVRGIRIVLLDSNSIIRLKKISIVSEEKEEIIEYSTDGVNTENNILCFFDQISDLYLWLPEDKKVDAIHIQYEILVYNSDILSIIGREFCENLFEISENAREKERELHDLNEKLIKENEKLIKENGSVNKKYVQLNIEKEQYLEENVRLKQDFIEINKKNNEIVEEKENFRKELYDVLQEKNNLSKKMQTLYENYVICGEELKKMENSISWKLTAPTRKIQEKIQIFGKLWENTSFYYRNYGLKASIYRAMHYKEIKLRERQQLEEISEQAQKKDLWDELDNWITNTPHNFIDIFPVPMGWNTPLFQRFQHLSLQAGNAGGISFYGAHPAVDKDVLTYKFINSTLCIVNLDNPDVTEKFWNLLDRVEGMKFVRIQSIDLATSISKCESFLKRGYQIVYEYIDELTPQITGNIPQFVYERHEYLLRNEDVTVVATSDKLFSQIKPYRNRNMIMLNNGVDYEHWNLKRAQIDCPKDIQEIVSRGKIIVGYHGALAQWIDYELLNRIAEDERYILLLIGYEHDQYLKKSNLLNKDNVYYIGPRNYEELNKYAVYYDIAILPFVVNNITLSVSPVKIFEYMAAGKPIVTYALPECQKYLSCLCANTQDEFLEQLEKAISLRNNKDYLEQLQKDALDNTWLSITKKMIGFIETNYERNNQKRKEISILNPLQSEKNKDQYIEEILKMPKYIDEEAFRNITNKPYKRQRGDCKIIAYYLTQFHPDKHNEEWWGRGTTEWNNVCRAVPQFIGHYQPRLPGELGFYDLRIMDNMKRQIELAKMYGIYGFCFYYYWFDGERLLEQPLEMFLQHEEMDFPFSLCWANENWTKRYDGTNTDILMEQPNSPESYRNVILDIARFLKDSRYIEIDGKKVITVYRPSLMPQTKSILSFWREYCRQQGLGELYLIAVKENMIDIDWLKEGFDAISEFHPGTLYTNCLNITNEQKMLRNDFGGEIYSYSDIVLKQKYFRYDLPKLYRAVMPMWDNTARRDNKGMIFQGSTPSLYKRWLKDVILAGDKRDDLEDNVIFINAWNEWGEGAYLEPDKRYGYAYLQATKEAVEECRNEEDE